MSEWAKLYCIQAIQIIAKSVFFNGGRRWKKRTVYRPKIVTAKVKDTGLPIDGHTLRLSLWAYDNYEQWHLYDWPDEADKAVMETMFATEKESGMNLYDTLEEFSEHWEEWEAQGAFCIRPNNAEILKVIQEESRTK